MFPTDVGEPCAMCDEDTNFTRIEVPYGYTIRMKNATEVEGHSDIVEVWLCKSCKEIAVAMVEEFDVSPFPEFDLANCRFQTHKQEIRSAKDLIENAIWRVTSCNDHDNWDTGKVKNAKILVSELIKHGDIENADQLSL